MSVKTIPHKYCTFLLLLVIFAGCNKSSDKASINSDKKLATDQAHILIESITQSPISRFGPILIHFRKAIGKAGEDAGDLVSTIPKFDANIKWISSTVLSIEPLKSLGRGNSFEVMLPLSSWKNIDSQVKDYRFKFTTQEQAMDLKVDGLVFEGDSETQQMSGSLNLVDKEENSVVESLLTAKQGDTKLKIEWNHGLLGLDHKFVVLGVERSSRLSEVVLAWNLKAIGIDKSDKRVIKVKPYNGFEVAHLKSVFGSSKHIQVIFNDPLNPKQNLKGLIEVDETVPSFKIDGSIVRIYFNEKMPTSITVTVNPGVEAQNGDRLKKRIVQKFSMPNLKPGVRFIGKGNILPSGENITVPFEAVNVDSVQVTAFRIFKNNLGHFFQENNLDGSNNLKFYGRYLWRKTIKLNVKDEQIDQWSRFNLELSELTNNFPNNLIRLELSINRGNSLYQCGDNDGITLKEEPFVNTENQEGIVDKSSWDFSESYYNQGNYNEDYRNRDNPCEDAYYLSDYYKSSNSRSSINIVKTNIGLIAKKGDDKNLLVIATDIKNGDVLENVEIKILNFQNQNLASATTDEDGFAKIELKDTPFLIRASKNGDVSYLKVNPSNSLSSTHFDVGGEVAKNGLKGTIYGERGVWRPGDDIHLVLALHDPNKVVPEDLPIKMSLADPNGTIFSSLAPTAHVNGFYYFKFKTNEDSITGQWKATGIVGPRKYFKSIPIEMVVPNRLKIMLDFTNIDKEPLGPGEREVDIFAQWLHGADASKLRTTVSVEFQTSSTAFAKYSDFQFDDITSQFVPTESEIFEGTLNSKGEIKANFNLKSSPGAPGRLNATFRTKVFEEGGAFSTETVSHPFYPYKTYVGIKPPKGDVARGMLLTDTEHIVEIVNVSSKGETTANNKIDITLHKITWKWWWDKKHESLANYETSRSSKLIESGTVAMQSGVGTWKFQVKYPEWGRYLLRACEQGSGHCTSKVIYIDWPGWAGRAQDVSGGSTSRLNITTDKSEYDIGEKATVFIPKTLKGKALVSIESSTKLQQQFWVDLEGEEKKVEFKVTKGMAPNIYVNISLIQPHHKKRTDAPLRLYGIASILITDPETKLEPTLETPKILAPLKSFIVSVSEAKGRAMTYTLAMVDEGLLGLTRFTSPELQKIFYQKGSLGVMTWDLFDQVIGAYNAKLESIIAIGGDDSLELDTNKGKKRRFPPVVQFIGPRHLKAKEVQELNLTMPNYVGAVRLMLIAGDKEAYGKASKSLQVKEDLMILPTLPRILGPKDSFEMPLTIFSMIDNMGAVNVSASASENISFPSGKQTSVSFEKQGQKMVYIPIEVDAYPGNAAISVFASSDKSKATKEVNLKVRLPNPLLIMSQSSELKGKESLELNYLTHGVNGSNSAVLVVSKTKPLNIEKRLQYLIRYPHGCIEQTTSAAFPQLFLPELLALSEKEKNQISANIGEAIKKLNTFQNSSGGLSYWAGQSEVDEWATTYAGHFLVMAKKYGHSVPTELLDGILTHQKEKANKWNPQGKTGAMGQAYRLLFLALVQNADVGAMNLLLKSELTLSSKWQLANALEVSGFKKQAQELVENIGFEVSEYRESSHTYGSRVRDLGIILSASTSLDSEISREVYNEISNLLSDNSNQYNTQGISFALIGAATYLTSLKSEGETSFEYVTNGKKGKNILKENMVKIPLSNLLVGDNKLQIKNTSDNLLYITRTVTGSPAIGKERSFNQNLDMSINYINYKASDTAFEVTKIKRGSQFIARVTVSNKSSKEVSNIALEYLLASGWDIIKGNSGEQVEKNFDYQDIRDDRIFTYFSLKGSETKTFVFVLQGTLAGKFYLPASKVEGMYDHEFSAQLKGKWIEVVK